jgi:hypothetical protein
VLRALEIATLLARQIQLTAAQDNQQFIRSDRCWTHERLFFQGPWTIVFIVKKKSFMGPTTITPNKLLIILSCCELNLTCKECCNLQSTKHLFTSCPKGKVYIFIRTTQLTETFFLGVVPCSIESRFCFYTMGSWIFPGCYR